MKKIILILFVVFGITLSSSAQQTARTQEQPKVRVVNFYPNPAASFINIDIKNGGSTTYNLQIFNFIGKPVAEYKNISSRNTINLTDYYRGIYIFKLTDRNGLLIESGKFQVIK